MIFKLFISVALLLLPFAAGKSPASEKSWEQLTNECKDAEKIRREALQLVTAKYNESESMVTYMATLTNFSRMMTNTRMAIEDVRSLLITDDLEKLPDSKKNPWVTIVIIELMSNKTQILETRLTQGAKDVPAEALEDNDFWTLLAAFQSSGEKLRNMGLSLHDTRPPLLLTGDRRSRHETDQAKSLASMFILQLRLRVLIANDSLIRVFTEARETTGGV